MKLSLIFNVFNKEKHIESVLDSWLSNLSKEMEYEIIIVFDDLKDNSCKIATKYLERYNYDYKFLFADNKFETYCNNLAFKQVTGDYIIFIQDDNWMYDKDWDSLLQEVIGIIDNVGAIGLLAGLELYPPMNYKRIEINRQHKGEYFCSNKFYELGVWNVDAINRPFCISSELFEKYGGFDEDFILKEGDDLDLSIRLLKDGKKNIYIPFDLVNTSAKKQTLSKQIISDNWGRGIDLCKRKHQEYLKIRSENDIKKICDLENIDNKLSIKIIK